MQTLQTINVGQAPNDGTGDEHRTAFQKVNSNFSKVVEGIDEVGDAAQGAADAAQAASQLASEAIPAVEKGVSGGVAPLDDAGKVPAEHLPEQEEFIPMAQKGAPAGVATLGVDGKVTPGQLPNAVDAIPLAQKGQPGGVATLDTEGLVPEDQLPDLSFVRQAEKGEPGGVATLDVDGLVPENQLPPIPSGPAVGTPDWWPLRSSIPAGQIPLDGQTVSRATYPDLAAMVIAGTLPVVADAAWQSDPTQRGMYTLGDGSTTIRVPDMNGKAAGSLGAVFRRGDGTRSAGAGGALQADVVGPHAHTTTMAFAVGSGSVWAAGNGASATYTLANGAGVGTETRPLNMTGVWTVHAFGAVVNPGSVDAAQLASDYGTLNALVQNLVDFTIIYPNGGTPAAPANIAVNSRYVSPNPFPGYRVMCQLELRIGGMWGSPGGNLAVQGTGAEYYGCLSTQYNDDSIITQTAISYLLSNNPGASLHPFPAPGSVTSAPARIKVWKIKGQI
jgi:hypothetical protein